MGTWLTETTGGELRVQKGFYKASIMYIDLQKGSYNGNYPPENVLDMGRSGSEAIAFFFSSDPELR